MTAKKVYSPTLKVRITEDRWQKAVQSNSGGCLIADAIRDSYPHLSHISVDMATARVTDRKAGYRFYYLTPPPGQHLLLGFDQGWPQPVVELTLKKAVVISPIIRSPARVAELEQSRKDRIAELEAKLKEKGKLTKHEQGVLSRLKNPKKTPARPSTTGKAVVRIDPGHSGVSVEGGTRPVQGKAHPNLLRGSNRHFGAKLADPGEVFDNAVKAEVENRLKTKHTLWRAGTDG